MSESQDRPRTAEEDWGALVKAFYNVAIIQGRIAYFLMSFHAVNPDIFNSVLNFDIGPLLWTNMTYGVAVWIFSRPSLKTISFFNRLSFGILGSLMFNHSSMLMYDWVLENFNKNRYLLTFMGFFTGRIMIVYLTAFLYHMDTRTTVPGGRVPRSSVFEAMYLTNGE